MRPIAYFLALIAVSLAGSCAPVPPPAAAPAGKGVTTSHGTYTALVKTAQWSLDEEEEDAPDPPGPSVARFSLFSAPAGPACTAKPSQQDGETFAGSAREVAKTTIARSSGTETFLSVVNLRATLRDDIEMEDLRPAITTRCSMARIGEEMRNVRLFAYLVAATKEEDNDYHLILGDRGCRAVDCFMTAEITGVPRIADDRAVLRTARDQFKQQVATFIDGGEPPRLSKYVLFDPPIPVVVSGSLFWDADHKIDRHDRQGRVGPPEARPNTSWEIHPVTHIVFEPPDHPGLVATRQ